MFQKKILHCLNGQSFKIFDLGQAWKGLYLWTDISL
jgi:hypothetical protein